MRRVLAILLCLLAAPLGAEEVVLGLSKDKVAITATFEGSEILVFGAVKREAPIPETPLDVVITVAGPSLPVTVRRKDRRFGIWVNTDEVRLDAAPTFYAVATTGPLDAVLTATEDLRHRVSIPRAIRSVGAASMAADAESFTEASPRPRDLDRRQDQPREQPGDVRAGESSDPGAGVAGPVVRGGQRRPPRRGSQPAATPQRMPQLARSKSASAFVRIWVLCCVVLSVLTQT